MSSVRDRYDRDTLNALQSIARSLDRIANCVEMKYGKKSSKLSIDEIKKAVRFDGVVEEANGDDDH